jgi:hypothetical protein
MGRIVGLTKALALVFACVVVAFAQEEDPGRGVARISVISGDVSVRRGDSGDWVAAAVNAPLVVQDQVSTAVGSRAEVQFDSANMLRVGSDSEVRLTDLESRRYQMQLVRGTVTFRVLRESEADVELSTPTVSVRPARKGIYRVSVRDDGQTEVTVRAGDVDIYTPHGVEHLKSGKTMLVRGTQADPEFQIVRALDYDDWDRWNERRDSDLERSLAYRYVHRDIYGADDLDPYGRWVYDGAYGWVWRPVVAIGWAPYRFGRWGWVDWYGWTWISSEPWGWAPYHYGRWYHSGPYGWCWYPGGFGRHYWSPALVAFFGFGGVHAGFGFGNVGWVPLAPYERFHPWWGRGYYGGYRSGRYIDNSVNIVNNVNITNVYRNARVSNGITAVNGTDFARGNIRNVVRVPHDDLQRANLVHGQLPVAPGTDSLRLSDREARVPVQRVTRNERFFATRQPASIDRVPFEQQRQALQQVNQRTFDRSRADSGQAQPGNRAGIAGEGRAISEQAASAAPSRTSNAASQGAANTTGAAPIARDAARDRGWRRFGENTARPASAATPAQAGAGTASPSQRIESGSAPLSENASRDAGWRRFGSAAEHTGGAQGRPSTAAPAETPASPRSTENGRGWSRFGESRVDRPAATERPSSQESGNPARGATAGPTAGGSPAAPARRNEEDRTWRRFGDPRPADRTTQPRAPAEPKRDPATPGRSNFVSGNDNWQRFGDPVRNNSETSGRSSGSEAFQRFETSRDSNRQSPRSEYVPRALDRTNQVQRNFSSFDRPAGRSQSIEISRPIVSERSAPRFESPGSVSRSGGGGAPRISGGGARSAAPSAGSGNHGNGGGGSRGGRSR